MALDPARLLAYPIPVAEQRLTPRDCILYALSLGLGADPCDHRQLRYVYERGLCALPMMATVLATPGFWLRDPATGVDWVRVLHGEQALTLHRQLPVEAALIGRSRITNIIDKGAAKGALLYIEREVVDADSGEHLCTLQQTAVLRGDGGFGGPSTGARRPPALPSRPPDLVIELATLPHAALLYRLNGDLNPLHADPDVARHAGYPRPILHGLGTFGIAGHAVLRACCDYDAGRLRSMAARFTAPVFPGETLATEIWRDGREVSFRTRAVERDVVALDNGRVTLGGD